MERQYTKRLVTSNREAEVFVWQQLPVIANHACEGRAQQWYVKLHGHRVLMLLETTEAKRSQIPNARLPAKGYNRP